jgi:hypothetical protein
LGEVGDARLLAVRSLRGETAVVVDALVGCLHEAAGEVNAQPPAVSRSEGSPARLLELADHPFALDGS